MLAIPIGMLAHTGIETMSDMAEEAKDEQRRFRRRSPACAWPCSAYHFALPAVALSALPVERGSVGKAYRTPLDLPEKKGGVGGDPVLGVVKAMDLGPLQGPIEIYAGIATAAKLAARRRRGIHVPVAIPVPSAPPVHGPMPGVEAAASSMLEQARVQGGNRVRGHYGHIRAGQAGRRIIEGAQDMRAAAVVLGLPRRVDGASRFGKTLETVHAKRPCREVIESPPPPYDERARRRRSRVHRARARA